LEPPVKTRAAGLDAKHAKPGPKGIAQIAEKVKEWWGKKWM
jgi:hypothetical protein